MALRIVYDMTLRLNRCNELRLNHDEVVEFTKSEKVERERGNKAATARIQRIFLAAYGVSACCLYTLYYF